MPESAGMVAVRLAVGAALLIVVVCVVPRTNWLVVGVTFKVPFKVRPPNVGVEVVPMDCGRDKVMSPVVPETLT